jgi:hypothetical protein
MKNFRAADKSHAGGDEKHDINFHWPYLWREVYTECTLAWNQMRSSHGYR